MIYLVGTRGAYAGSEIPVQGELILGRDARVVQIVFAEGNKGISGTHCKVINRNGQLILMDLNSTNGTFLENGERLKPNVPYSLENGQGFYLTDSNNMFKVRVEREVVPVQQPVSAPVAQPVIQPVQQPEKKNSTGKTIAITVGIAAIVVVLGLLGYALYQETHKSVVEETFDVIGDWIDVF